MPVTVADLWIANLACTLPMTQDSLYVYSENGTYFSISFWFLKLTIFQ